jgi:hypothetical protein
MALEFPHAEVLGIDLEPRLLKEPPSNCSFVRHDIDSGLSQYYGMYDLVHCRFAGHGVSIERVRSAFLHITDSSKITRLV